MKKHWLMGGAAVATACGLGLALDRAFAQDPAPAGRGGGGGRAVIEAGGPGGAPAIQLGEGLRVTVPAGAPPAITVAAPTGAGSFAYMDVGGYPGAGGFSFSSPVFTDSPEGQQLLAEDSQLEQEVANAVAQYSDSQASEETRAALRNRLGDLLDAQFNARQKRRELEIQQIEERVKSLREALDKRADAKDKIIERRLNDLLTDAEGLGWGDAGSETRAGVYGGSPYGPSMGGPRSPYGPMRPGASPYGPGAGGPGRGRGEGGSMSAPARAGGREGGGSPYGGGRGGEGGGNPYGGDGLEGDVDADLSGAADPPAVESKSGPPRP